MISKNLSPANTLVDAQLRTAMGQSVGTFRRAEWFVEVEKGIWQGGWEAAKRKRLSFKLPFSQASTSPRKCHFPKFKHLELNYPKSKDDGAGNHDFQLPGININGRQLSTKFDVKSPRKASVSRDPQPQPFPGRILTLHHLTPLKILPSLGKVMTYALVRNLH